MMNERLSKIAVRSDDGDHEDDGSNGGDDHHDHGMTSPTPQLKWGLRDSEPVFSDPTVGEWGYIVI